MDSCKTEITPHGQPYTPPIRHVNRQVRQALVVRPEIKAFVADYIKSANK